MKGIMAFLWRPFLLVRFLLGVQKKMNIQFQLAEKFDNNLNAQKVSGAIYLIIHQEKIKET